MIKFCGFTIKPLKVVKDVKDVKEVNEEKIILSTWSNPDINAHYYTINETSNIYASDVSNFLDGFIGNIETFNFKIQKYTSKPSKWVYRVYIDETYLNAKELIDNLIDIDKEIKDNKYKKEHSKEYTKTNNNIINEFDPLYNSKKNNIIYSYTAYISREQVLKSYIKLISESTDPKYNNIEIYTYNNDDLHIKTITTPHKQLSDVIMFSGSIVKYHALLDKNATAVIIRNCYPTITPLDIIIQNYWLTSTKTKFGNHYMEYIRINKEHYSIDLNRIKKLILLDVFYPKNAMLDSKTDMVNRISQYNNVVNTINSNMFSCRVNGKFYTSDYYNNILNKLYNKITNIIDGYEIKNREYVKEILYNNDYQNHIHNFIFPDAYIFENMDDSVDTIHNKHKHQQQLQTFRVLYYYKGFEGYKLHNNSLIIKCNKTKFLSLIENARITKHKLSHTEHPIQLDDKEENKESKNSKKRNDNKSKIKTNTKTKTKTKTKSKSKTKTKSKTHNTNTKASGNTKTSDNTNTKASGNTKTSDNNVLTCSFNDLYKSDHKIQLKNLSYDDTNNPLQNNQLHGMRTQPFKNININTWPIKQLYDVCLSNNNKLLFLNIPHFKILDYKINIKYLKSGIVYPHKFNNYKALIAHIDKYVNIYMNDLDTLYNINNLYPVIIYPTTLLILDNNNTEHALQFHKLLTPIKDTHGLKFL